MLNQVCMRSVAAALMAAVSVLALAGCGDEQQPPAAQNTPASAMPFTIQTEPLTAGAGEHLLVLNVEGMTCDGEGRDLVEMLLEAGARPELDRTPAWL